MVAGAEGGASSSCWSSSSRDVLLELVVGAGSAGSATEVATLPSPAAAPLLLACSLPGGGALVQASGGALWRYLAGGRMEAVPLQGCFPVSCPRMAAVPDEPPAASAAADASGAPALRAVLAGAAPGPAIGLATTGQLFWGSRLLASDATSFVLRGSGAGGAHLVYTTRQHTMRLLPLAALLLAGSSSDGGAAAAAANGAAQRQEQQQAPRHFYAAIRAAMQPAGAGAASVAHDVSVRSVEQHALLVAAPPGVQRWRERAGGGRGRMGICWLDARTHAQRTPRASPPHQTPLPPLPPRPPPPLQAMPRL